MPIGNPGVPLGYQSSVASAAFTLATVLMRGRLSLQVVS